MGSYKIRNPLTSKDCRVLHTRLVDEFGGRHHNKAGGTKGADYYLIVEAYEDSPTLFTATLSGPSKNFATAVVDFSLSNPKYKITPGPGCRASLDLLENQIMHGFREINRKTAGERYSGPMNKSRWRGYYMFRATGKLVTAGDTAMALNAGEIDKMFFEVCKRARIYFLKYPRPS